MQRIPVRPLSAQALLSLGLAATVLIVMHLPVSASPGTQLQSVDRPCAELSQREIRPEATRWNETSTHAEVLSFLEEAARCRSDMALVPFGYSMEGRPLPLLVVSATVEESTDLAPEELPGALLEGNRLRVYLQANIHAGEVAGKEALLRLVRRIVADEAYVPPGVDLLIAPIYNADGNEALRLTHRPRQHGPMGGMGTRTNAMGLDLNRDQMKLDSPEARALARLMTTWDPHVVVDLHTTNGTRHAYHLTYSPPLHPATPEAIDVDLRQGLLPRVTTSVEEGTGWHVWHYGNVFERGGVRGWWTFDHRPRFVTNYAGLRNRVGILSEAYSYLSFEDRVRATEVFVDAILEDLGRRPVEVRQMVEAEQARDLRGHALPVRAGFAEEAPVQPILMGAVTEERHPGTGDVLLLRADEVRVDSMPAWIGFEGTEDVIVPHAYLLPAADPSLVERLRAHGISVEPLDEAEVEGEMEVEVFRVEGVSRASGEFQGRTEMTVDGRWEAARRALPPGSMRVDLLQPEARLAVLLLEPRADDGFLNWGILAPDAAEGNELPLFRVGPPGR